MPGAISGWMSCTSRRSFLFVLRSSTYGYISLTLCCEMGGPLFSSGIFLTTSSSSISSLLIVCGLHLTVLDLRACHAWKGCVPPPHISFPGTGAAHKQGPKASKWCQFSHSSAMRAFEPRSTPHTLPPSHTSMASS